MQMGASRQALVVDAVNVPNTIVIVVKRLSRQEGCKQASPLSDCH